MSDPNWDRMEIAKRAIPALMLAIPADKRSTLVIRADRVVDQGREPPALKRNRHLHRPVNLPDGVADPGVIAVDQWALGPGKSPSIPISSGWSAHGCCVAGSGILGRDSPRTERPRRTERVPGAEELC